MLEEDSGDLNGSDSDIEIEVCSLVWFVYISSKVVSQCDSRCQCQ